MFALSVLHRHLVCSVTVTPYRFRQQNLWRKQYFASGPLFAFCRCNRTHQFLDRRVLGA